MYKDITKSVSPAKSNFSLKTTKYEVKNSKNLLNKTEKAKLKSCCGTGKITSIIYNII
jgi:hypothetical protein